MTPQFAFSLQSQLLPLGVLLHNRQSQFTQTHTHALTSHLASQNNNYYNKQSVHTTVLFYCALSPQNSQNIHINPTEYNPSEFLSAYPQRLGHQKLDAKGFLWFPLLPKQSESGMWAGIRRKTDERGSRAPSESDRQLGVAEHVAIASR